MGSAYLAAMARASSARTHHYHLVILTTMIISLVTKDFELVAGALFFASLIENNRFGNQDFVKDSQNTKFLNDVFFILA